MSLYKCVDCETNIPQRVGLYVDCSEQRRYSKITEGLWLSNFENSQDYGSLERLGIKQILTVGNDGMIHSTEDVRIKYIRIDDSPMTNIRQYFEEAHDFIRTSPTLVHCSFGISRSPAIVISFLMKEYNMTLQASLDYCRQSRPFVQPNIGFMRQLKNYEKELLRFH